MARCVDSPQLPARKMRGRGCSQGSWAESGSWKGKEGIPSESLQEEQRERCILAATPVGSFLTLTHSVGSFQICGVNE